MAVKEYYKNAQTWKPVSTNLPPEMHQALKSRVTKDYTMSHVLREIISESEVMRAGLPQPRWSVELTETVAALKEEVAVLRKELELREESRSKTTAAFKNLSWRAFVVDEAQAGEPEEELIVPAFMPEQESGSELPSPQHERGKAKWPFLGRLTEIFGVARQTA